MGYNSCFLWLLLFIILVDYASASYIAGDVYVDDRGFTRFNVESDVPINLEGLSFQNNKITGTTPVLTNKEAGVWTFSMNAGNYSSILLDVHLPKNLNSISSLEGVERVIDPNNQVISLIDSGKLDFRVSYRLKESANYSWIFWPVLFVVVLGVYFVIKKTRKRKEHLEHVFPLINDNEQKVIELLMKKPMRQKEIRKVLGFPKASFSRYLINLEKKKLILREGEGKNKVVRLK
jgi:uncharacterized membrane protein